MNTLNRKNISVALLITLGAIFSVNANAAPTNSIENSLTEMVFTQSQLLVSDLSDQLQQSIEEELSSFTIDFSFDESITESLAWLSEEEATHADVNVKERKHPESN